MQEGRARVVWKEGHFGQLGFLLCFIIFAVACAVFLFTRYTLRDFVDTMGFRWS